MNGIGGTWQIKTKTGKIGVICRYLRSEIALRSDTTDILNGIMQM